MGRSELLPHPPGPSPPRWLVSSLRGARDLTWYDLRWGEEEEQLHPSTHLAPGEDSHTLSCVTPPPPHPTPNFPQRQETKPQAFH